MGIKVEREVKVKVTHIERDKVYLVKKIVFGKEDNMWIRAFTTLEKAEEFVGRYNSERFDRLCYARNGLGHFYDWIDSDGYEPQHCLRISEIELDLDYGETGGIRLNPSSE